MRLFFVHNKPMYIQIIAQICAFNEGVGWSFHVLFTSCLNMFKPAHFTRQARTALGPSHM